VHKYPHNCFIVGQKSAGLVSSVILADTTMPETCRPWNCRLATGEQQCGTNHTAV